MGRFIKRQDNGKVYRLIKALYGLRQAPRAWNIQLDNTLKSLDFKKCALEQAIYTKTSKDSTLLLGVYVDDLIITGTPKKEIDKFKAQMEEKFKMSYLGLLSYYLGIEVTQTDGDISIKQSAYANKILKEAGMLDCNETLKPMDPGTRLTKVTEGTMVNSTEYQSLIGCLRYLLHTRPDLSYSVGLLSRFMQEPREQHMKAIKKVLRYIKGTKDYGITYMHNEGNKIHGFSDSSYGVNTQEGKGTTGIIFYYGESPISWSTQKQATVALSSGESEFITATATATQALWLKRLLSKLTHSQEEKVIIKVDNKSAITLMKNLVFHGRSKHTDTKYHFIRECVEREDIQVKFEYMSEHINDEPEWTDFKIGNLEVTNEHYDQGIQPIEEDNEFPNNDDDDYASSTRDSPTHSQAPHTPSTRSSQVNSQVIPNISTQSNYQSDNVSIQTTNSPSHFDHTPLRGFRILNDLYENTEELLLVEDEPKNYKQASRDQKWIEAIKVKLDSININNTWELTTLPKGHKAIGLKWVFKTKKDANGNIIKHKVRLVTKGYIQEHGLDFEEVFAPVARMETIQVLLAIDANNKWEVHHLDVKYSFLHGDLKEEVYVIQPEGFVKRQDNGKVYRLIKALYGLRQAPRA
nr:ribonuclease H-like domain, reverse transcriptase, RNA-dependent DNA polymerase [Tanacetum cinerariifolium]